MLAVVLDDKLVSAHARGSKKNIRGQARCEKMLLSGEDLKGPSVTAPLVASLKTFRTTLLIPSSELIIY